MTDDTQSGQPGGNRFSLTFTAKPEHIDANGHVNNAVWLQWAQDLSTGHWMKVARAEDIARFVWFVTRHEIDYRGNVEEGARVIGTTFIPNPPRGARFDRRVDFMVEGSDTPIVSLTSTWAMIEKESGRLARVRREIAAPFEPFGGE
jgi:acyl-CoA thioester hydrolase